MANDKIVESIEVLTDLVKKILAVQLLSAGLPKEEIRKRLHMNANELSDFLKGIKGV